MKRIRTSNGPDVLVDDDKFELLSRYRWRVLDGYAITNVGKSPDRKTVQMHRLVLPNVGQIDHKNGNRLDNTRENLRPSTQSQNMGNRRKQAGTSSRFKGVSWNARYRKWQAFIHRDGKNKNLGSFTDETDAARAYDTAATLYFGAFARTNL